MKIHHLFPQFFIIGFLISCNSLETKKAESKSPEESITVAGYEVIEELELGGFFNITDNDKVEAAKSAMINSYNNHSYFGGLTYTDSLAFVDHRFYRIDQEALFEPAGLTTYLNKVKPTFSLLGLKLDVSKENTRQESCKDGCWEHTIALNGQEYIAFKGEINEYSWARAMVNFANMLNDQLKLQNSDEQVYLIYSGNDGMLVFLTLEMFEVVVKNYPFDENRPMSVLQWKKYYEIE